jgi:signal transduction histidine kinase
MTKASILLIFIVCFFGQSQICAQHTTLVKYFGTENGLPSNGIKGLQWDETTGFLWIATEAGIVRYNGISFKTFSAEDEPNITNERSLFLVKNNKGHIYTSDFPGNIFRVNQNKLVYYETNSGHSVPGNVTFALGVSEKLYKAREKTDPALSFYLQFHRAIPLSDTSCLIFTATDCYRYSLSTAKPVALSLPEGRPGSAFSTGSSIFFVDQTKKLFLFDPEKMSTRLIPLQFEGPGPELTKNEFYWQNGMAEPVVLNGKNAYSISYKEGKLNARLICTSIPENILIRYIQYDPEGHTLFLGTNSNGLIVIDESNIESVNSKIQGQNKSTSYYAQLELTGGNILTNEGNIVGKNKTITTTPPTEKAFSNFIYKAGDSLLWYIQHVDKLKATCLHCYDYRTGKTTAYPKARLGTQTVMTMVKEHLFFINNIGIGQLENDSIRYFYKHPDDNNISRLHFDLKEIVPGVLGIASCNALLQFNIATHKLDTLYNAGKYCVRSLWKYKDYLFFGTYGNGLFIYRNGKVKALPLDKNKYLLFTHCFIEDASGHCWISTNRGLFKTRVSDMTDAFDKDNPFVFYQYFGRDDGMQITEMNGGCVPCAIKLKDKTISFPTMEGLLWVDAGIPASNTSKNKLYIDKFLVNRKSINPDSLFYISLPAQTNEIELRLAYPGWEKKENIYIEYQLDKETDWTSFDEANIYSIRLNGLSAGEHRLKIRKANGFGHNNYILQEIDFFISSKWYQRWWFYLLCVAAAFGLVYLFILLRTRQYKARQRKLEAQVEEKTRELQEKNDVLEKNDSLKTRLISIISHDIVAPLKFLTMAGKNLVSKKEAMSSQMQEETLGEIANTSQELQLLSTNLLNWIKYQNKNRRQMKEMVRVHEMVNQSIGVLRSVANQKQVMLVNATSTSLIVKQYFEPLKVIIYNLLTNAINFTEKGEVRVSSSETENEVILSVQDQGSGMTKEQINNLTNDEIIISSINTDNRKGHGLGYLIIKDLLKITGATIRFESRKNQGTIVSVIIKKEKEVPGSNPATI